jgi:hypothetical protein
VAWPCSVRVKITNPFERKTIWNVIGKIPGSVEPERSVILGNHRCSCL